MPLVSITRLRVRYWRFLPPFVVAAFRSLLQARGARGNLGVRVLRDAGNAFWTCTLWTDEAAMILFREAGAHGGVMPKLRDWCDEASVVHWIQESAREPSWEEAYLRMQREGRTSKVNHPSEAHRRFDIPAPKTGRMAELRLR